MVSLPEMVIFLAALSDKANNARDSIGMKILMKEFIPAKDQQTNCKVRKIMNQKSLKGCLISLI